MVLIKVCGRQELNNDAMTYLGGITKAIDYVQQNYLKQGDQSNESAIEQMKDEQVRLCFYFFLQVLLLIAFMYEDFRCDP